MNQTMIRIKAYYDKLGKSERKIADWVLTHPDEILPISISELAERSSSSEATIVRFSRRLGFSGFQDFKISFANYTPAGLTDESVSESDDCLSLFGKVVTNIYTALEKTRGSLDASAMEQAVQALLRANRVVLFGLGSSASVAQDAAHKFLRLGINAYPYSDNHMQVIAASQLKEGDLAMGFSHSGSSLDVVDALKIARQRGAATIAVTGSAKSPITKTCDITLSTLADETKHNILALTSRISQLAIIDALYFRLICLSGDKSVDAIRVAEDALKNKKY